MSLWVYSFLSTTWLVFQTCLSVICSQFHAKYYTTKTDMLLQNYIWLIWQPTRQTIYKTSWLMSWFNILININFTWNFQIQECLKTTYFVSCLEIMTLCWLFKIDGSKTYIYFYVENLLANLKESMENNYQSSISCRTTTERIMNKLG